MGDITTDRFAILHGDAEERLYRDVPSESVDIIVTSFPYYKLRDYGVDGQIGWESTPQLFAKRIVAVLRQCSRVLRPHGLIWSIYDDTRRGGSHANTDAMMCLALDSIGLEKLHEIIWYKKSTKPNGTDKTMSHLYEKILVFKKRGVGSDYYWDAFESRQKTDNGDDRRLTDVWEILPVRSRGPNDHIAMYPPEIAKKCLAVGTSARGYCGVCRAPWRRVFTRSSEPTDPSRPGGRTLRALEHKRWEPSCEHLDAPVVRGVVLDPFSGSGRTGVESLRLKHNFLGVELNGTYVKKSARDMFAVVGGRGRRL